MELNVQKLLKNPGVIFEGTDEYDYSSREFPGFYMMRPVRVDVAAHGEGDVLVLNLKADALVGAECARCLAPVAAGEVIEKQYRVSAEELAGEYPELPMLRGGNVDVEEFVYGELLIEVSGILLCSPDCEGLCARCGKRRAECLCPPGSEGDERLAVLRQLLQEDPTGDE